MLMFLLSFPICLALFETWESMNPFSENLFVPEAVWIKDVIETVLRQSSFVLPALDAWSQTM